MTRRLAWALINERDGDAVYLRTLLLVDMRLDCSPRLEEAIVYFSRAAAGDVLRAYLSRRDWRVVPIYVDAD